MWLVLASEILARRDSNGARAFAHSVGPCLDCLFKDDRKVENPQLADPTVTLSLTACIQCSSRCLLYSGFIAMSSRHNLVQAYAGLFQCPESGSARRGIPGSTVQQS